MTTLVPNYDGTIRFSTMSDCDCDNGGEVDDVEPAENPLEQIDTDDDGESDDDGDGIDDDDDHGRCHSPGGGPVTGGGDLPT